MEKEDVVLRLTKKERAAVAALHKLAKTWPKSLWLFSNGIHLSVMRYKKDGTVALEDRGGMAKSHVVDTVNIPSDGGDWD